MAGASYVLDKTYKETDSAGVTRFRAVIPGTNDGECKLPTTDAQFALGITQENQANQNENVAVRKDGISRFYANGNIAVGDPLEVKGTDGRLQKATLTAGSAAVHYILGTSESTLADGEEGFIKMNGHYVSVPAS